MTIPPPEPDAGQMPAADPQADTRAALVRLARLLGRQMAREAFVAGQAIQDDSDQEQKECGGLDEVHRQ